jgi:hypothetical protein
LSLLWLISRSEGRPVASSWGDNNHAWQWRQSFVSDDNSYGDTIMSR